MNRYYLNLITLYLIVESFLKRRMFNFESLVKQKKRPLKNFERNNSLKVIMKIAKLSKILGINSCFTKCLAYKAALNLSGCKYKLYVGVKYKSNEFCSHCWIETNGLMNEGSENLTKFKIMKVYE